MNLPALELVEDLDRRGLLVRVAGGPFEGHVALVMSTTPPPRPDDGRPRARPRRAAPNNPVAVQMAAAKSPRSRRVAEDLLVSLLDAEQRASWRAHRRFWVDTPRGRVRLGRLYDLRHRPGDGTERSICVVPVDHMTLPPADIWVNLLLLLRTDPDRFFRVAIPNPG